MEYMWSGIVSEEWVSELVLMSIIWLEICFLATL